MEIAIIGCGGISHAHARAARSLDGRVRFAACCDTDAERARALAAKYGAERTYASLAALLEAESPPAVLLATWPNLHRAQIETCLAAGVRNILCEKALAVSGAEASEIYDLAHAAGAFLMEGFMYRQHPAIRTIEQRIAAGAVGEVDYVRAVFNLWDAELEAPDDATRNWRQRKEAAGGVPFDLACYAVNACGHFAGGVPVRASATGSVSERYGTINRLAGIVEYANGRIGIVESSRRSSFSQELLISGSHGTLHLPVAWSLDAVTLVTRRWSPKFAVMEHEDYAVEQANSYALQLDNFAQAAAGRTQPVVPLVQSVVNAYVSEALNTSLLERRSVAIDLPEPIAADYRSWLANRRNE
jgi:predicted dehydrogenase